MSEIEKMERYIKRTAVNKPERYEMGMLESRALLDDTADMLDAVYTAFLYGRAKGYRAAKAEVRK